MIPKRLLKTARTLYLYADGHAVIWHEQTHKQAGHVDWVTLHETLGVETAFEQGRITSGLHGAPAVLAMLDRCERINFKPADLAKGSKITKERGISIASLLLNFGGGWINIPTLPDSLISGPFTYQPEKCEEWAEVRDAHSWSGMRVSEIFHKPPERKAA